MEVDPALYPWVSVAVIAWGLLDCFFGYRVFKVTLGLLGGILGLGLGHVGATALGFGGAGAVVLMVIAGILGASVAFLLYTGAVFVAGFGFGSTLGLLVLNQLIPTVTLVGGLVFGILGGFLAVQLQRVLLIVATALLGSFRAVLATAYFTSQLDWLYYFRQPQQLPAVIDTHGWLMPTIFILAAIGVIAQFELGGSQAKKKAKPAAE